MFSEHGLDASLDEIARRAGVGNATLYRRFPTRQDLIAAVFADRKATQVDLAERALENADPWSGFVEYVTAVCELQSTNRGLGELLVTVNFDGDERKWRLVLKPLDPRMQEVVSEIRIGGSRDWIGSIEFLEPGGDRSVMSVTRDAR